MYRYQKKEREKGLDDILEGQLCVFNLKQVQIRKYSCYFNLFLDDLMLLFW